MTGFANAYAFRDPASHKEAMGCNVSNPIVDARGNVLGYAQTGGMLAPQRYALAPGAMLYRFAGPGPSPLEAANGRWWVEHREFEKLFAFAQVHGLAIGMAMRCLCLVPPEWNKATLLIRACVVRDLLAWRGLANSVVARIPGTNELVRLPHQNEIAARRLHQLFIPGLGDALLKPAALTVESSYSLEGNESLRGFLYV